MVLLGFLTNPAGFLSSFRMCLLTVYHYTNNEFLAYVVMCDVSNITNNNQSDVSNITNNNQSC